MGNTSTGIPIPVTNIPAPRVGPVNPITPAPPAPKPTPPGQVSELNRPAVDAVRAASGLPNWTPEGS